MSVELIKDRLVRFIDMENMSPTQFADALGVQRSTVSHLLSGRNNPSYDFIVKILNNYKYLSADWLLCGVGEMYRQQDAHMGNLFSQPAVPAPEAASPAADPVARNEAARESVATPETLPAAAHAAPAADAPATASAQPEATTQPLLSSVEKRLGRAIQRIVIFYNDKSMDIYES